MLQTGSLVSSGDFSSTSRSRPSAFPLLNLLMRKRTFCPGIPFFTVTYLSSSARYTIPLFGKSTLSIVPSKICPFFISSSTFVSSASSQQNRQGAVHLPHPACILFHHFSIPDPSVSYTWSSSSK